MSDFFKTAATAVAAFVVFWAFVVIVFSVEG